MCAAEENQNEMAMTRNLIKSNMQESSGTFDNGLNKKSTQFFSVSGVIMFQGYEILLSQKLVGDKRQEQRLCVHYVNPQIHNTHCHKPLCL